MDPHFDGVLFQTHSAELWRRLHYSSPVPFQVLDLRSKADYDAGHIAGARWVELRALASDFPPGASAGTELILVGENWADTKVRQASLALRALGAKRIVELPGGMTEWRTLGYPVETAAPKAA